MKIQALMLIAMTMSVSLCNAECVNSTHKKIQGHGSHQYSCKVSRNDKHSFKQSEEEVGGHKPMICKGCGCVVDAHTA